MYHVRIITKGGTLVLPTFAVRADAIRMASHLVLAYGGRVSITFVKED